MPCMHSLYEIKSAARAADTDLELGRGALHQQVHQHRFACGNDGTHISEPSF